LRRTPELFQRWVRERLVQAEKISTTEYVKGRRELDRVRREVEAVFQYVDVLLTPTVSVSPIEVEEAVEMSPPAAGEIWLRNTRPFNSYGLPTISIPCGLTGNGLPIGLQIAGPRFQEAKVLAFAYAFEQATEWHKLTPPVNAELLSADYADYTE